MDIQQIAHQCKTAAISLSSLTTQIKNNALENIITALNHNAEHIFEANAKDLEQAKKGNLEAPLLKRLKFDAAKLLEACDGDFNNGLYSSQKNQMKIE